MPPSSHPSRRLLETLARKVRQARTARGYSLQETADHAGFSRRFLVEIEAARANPSIGKLSALSEALGIPLRELCDLPGSASAPRRIALVGLRGAGKSTIGRMLAQALEVPFAELDEVIEELAGLTVSEIFELHGTDGYRRLESEALETWLARHGTGVLAMPGGVVTSPRTYERLLSTCRTVFLQATPEDHWERVVLQGDTRPMRNQPRAMDRLRALLEERTGEYGRAEITFSTTNRSPDTCVKLLADELNGISASS